MDVDGGERAPAGARSMLCEARAILALGWPLVLNNVFNIGMQVTDTLMAGHLSALDLAAISLGGGIYMPLFLLGLGVLLSVSAFTAQHTGAGRLTRVGETSRQGLWLAVVVAAGVMLALRNAEPVLALLDLTPGLVERAQGYLSAMAWGLGGLYLFQVLRLTSEGLGRTRPIMFFTLGALPVNALGNYLFMYGHAGFPQLGATGCGWATALTMWIMALAMAIFIRRSPAYAAAGVLARRDPPDPHVLGRLVRVGVPIGLGIFLESGFFGVVTLTMGLLGAAAVAAHQIAFNFAATMFMVPLGLGFAITVRVGHAAGAGSAPGVQLAGRSGIALCALAGSLTGVITLLGAPYIVRAYTGDATLIAVAVHLLYVGAMFQIFDAVQMGALGALRGLHDTRVPMLFSLIGYWGIGYPLSWVLGLGLGYGPVGVWGGLVAGLAFTALAHPLRFFLVAHRRWRPARPGVVGASVPRH